MSIIQQFSLEGHVAIVTGAAARIGRRIAALFLCSPAAAWVSGQVLTVSGGGSQELS